MTKQKKLQRQQQQQPQQSEPCDASLRLHDGSDQTLLLQLVPVLHKKRTTALHHHGKTEASEQEDDVRCAT
jgi:hypothetical protein